MLGVEGIQLELGLFLRRESVLGHGALVYTG